MREPQPLEVTEHRGHRCLCAACGTVTTAVFPNGVSAPVQYGPRISARVTDLLHAQFIPEMRVAEVMSDLFAAQQRHTPPETRAATVMTVARIGGHIHRTKGPPPGTEVMWRGYATLVEWCVGYQLRMEHERKRK